MLIKKKRNELSKNSQIMVDTVDNIIDEHNFPITVFGIDPTVDEIIEATRFILNTGWISGHLFGRKIEYLDKYGQSERGVYFVTDEKDFNYGEAQGHFVVLKDYPVVMGIFLRDNGEPNAKVSTRYPNKEKKGISRVNKK